MYVTYDSEELVIHFIFLNSIILILFISLPIRRNVLCILCLIPTKKPVCLKYQCHPLLICAPLWASMPQSPYYIMLYLSSWVFLGVLSLRSIHVFLSFRYFYPKVSEFWTFCSDFSPFDSIEFALHNNYNHENLSLDLNNYYKNSLYHLKWKIYLMQIFPNALY